MQYGHTRTTAKQSILLVLQQQVLLQAVSRMILQRIRTAFVILQNERTDRSTETCLRFIIQAKPLLLFVTGFSFTCPCQWDPLIGFSGPGVSNLQSRFYRHIAFRRPRVTQRLITVTAGTIGERKEDAYSRYLPATTATAERLIPVAAIEQTAAVDWRKSASYAQLNRPVRSG